MQELGKYVGSKRLEFIGKDMEKYITSSIDDFIILDSYNFLASPLDTLASTLSNFRFVELPQLYTPFRLSRPYLDKRVYIHTNLRMVWKSLTLPLYLQKKLSLVN